MNNYFCNSIKNNKFSHLQQKKESDNIDGCFTVYV